ncbi:MAG: phosphotransferase [Gammaproteobacteria bacterium]|nr:phosphotransferase [Gammaproteobacteria bacterium]
MTDLRLQQANSWLTNSLRLPITQLKPIAGDASFRRYFRVYLPNESYILMDAPPSHENCKPYITIGRELLKHNIHVPRIFYDNLEQGFLLLEDLGDKSFFSALKIDNVDLLYRQALEVLVKIQKITYISNYDLPKFDESMMMREMMLFQEWFIEGLLKHPLNATEKNLLAKTFQQIAEKIASFQQCCVHRDYHSRNLMVLPSGDLGVLDFQDAVWGPITYDAISLLKDCYISWPRDKILDLLGYYHHLLSSAQIIEGNTFSDFINEFDWVGIQRHIKVIGIFSRLHLRDHKSAYLNDIPLAMRYLVDALNPFQDLNDFRIWLDNILSVNEFSEFVAQDLFVR